MFVENYFNFVKGLYKENFKKYKFHFRIFDKIDDYEIKWSNSYIDFYPYESIMDGLKPAVIYKDKPKSDKLIQNRLKNNEIYYSFKYLNKEWGTEFYINDEKNNKIRLFYENQNENEKMLLSQLYYKEIECNLINKVFCYMYDPDMEEETLYIFEYKYENNKISKIIRYDYFDMENEMIFYENDLIKRKIK
jgi:hypothetical protein